MATEFSAEALGRALERVGADIKREIGELFPVAGAEAVSTLEARYPFGRKHNPAVPHMRDDIFTRRMTGTDVLLPIIRVTGPHLAYIWQDGTAERIDATRRNARRGRMPAADPGFYERTAVTTRQRMLDRAQQIIDRPREIE